jgi:uncharacterized protein (DUF1684 family)
MRLDFVGITTDYLDLLDYRRRVSAMYASARDWQTDEATRLERFRREHEALLRTHPQSALSAEQKARFTGLKHFPYDPSLRFALPLEMDEAPKTIDVELRHDGLLRLRRIGKVRFRVDGQYLSLSLFWIHAYGGGLFVPFRDLTSTETTYPGGRYLLDTIKGADLGHEDSKLVIDFNYAYNPSCAYHSRWDCPLAPPENHLPVAIRAGEQRFPG